MDTNETEARTVTAASFMAVLAGVTKTLTRGGGEEQGPRVVGPGGRAGRREGTLSGPTRDGRRRPNPSVRS